MRSLLGHARPRIGPFVGPWCAALALASEALADQHRPIERHDQGAADDGYVGGVVDDHCDPGCVEDIGGDVGDPHGPTTAVA
jgi:hypothetical protein